MTKQKNKKKVARKDNPYAALDVSLNLKTRHDEIADIASYADQLSHEDKVWLNAYVEEEICANFNHKGPKLNDSSDPKVRSRIYLQNNARNRDVYSRETAQGTMNYLDEIEREDQVEAEEKEGTGY